MVYISKVIDFLTNIVKKIAMVVVILMIPITTVGVVSRFFGHPIVGVDEAIVILLIVQIMFSMAYAQSKDKHINIDLIVNHFPKRIQSVIDILGYLATAIVCLIVAYIFFGAAYEDFSVTKKGTLLFEFPYYILKLVCAIGFMVWGLEALNQIIKRFISKEKILADKQKEESA